jgi:DNA-directed RNA polymerase specialized sigma24 family protein
MVQLVFLKLFTGLHKFDRSKSPFGAYVNLLTANVVLDELRGRKRRPVIQLDEATILAKGVRAGEIEIEELWGAVLQYMQGLQNRNQFILGDFLDGIPTQRICSKHHIRPNALYSIVYRFKKALRNGFKNNFPVGGRLMESPTYLIKQRKKNPSRKRNNVKESKHRTNS